MTAVEKQRYGSIRIRVRSFEEQLVERDVSVELFANLAAESVGVRFVRIDFAAGEFPHSLEVNTLLAAREEEAVAVGDHRRDDFQTALGTASSVMRTRSASCAGVNGFCSSGTPPQNAPCTAVASSL